MGGGEQVRASLGVVKSNNKQTNIMKVFQLFIHQINATKYFNVFPIFMLFFILFFILFSMLIRFGCDDIGINQLK